jgi:cytochrome c oxidase subunit 2
MLFAEVEILPPQASTLAWDVDVLFWYIHAVAGTAFALVTATLIYFAFTYCRRGPDDVTPRILGSHRLELIWTLTPLFVFLSFFAWGATIYTKALQRHPDAPEVYVVGKQWMWKIQHPGGQREINELHLPVGRTTRVTYTSEDVIHDFGVPAFRTKIDVVPGRYVTNWYHPTKVGRYDLFCDQYCGQGHTNMIGTVVVMEQAEFEDWLQGKTAEAGKTAVDGSLAWEGRKLFLKLQCLSCHSGNSKAKAPVLEGLYGARVPLADGRSVTVDESYIRESILRPRAKVVEGWQAIMPTYQGQVSEEEVIQLIAYIKSLRPGTTPIRTEDFPAPVGAPTEPSPGERKNEGAEKK